MRQLFLPACLCLMTWSAPATPNAKISLAQFTGARPPEAAKAAAAAPATSGDSSGRREAAAAEMPEPAEPEMAIEFPAPGTLSLAAALADGPPLPRRRPPPRPVVHRTAYEICSTLTQAAKENDVPATFFIRLLFQESRFKPGVVSSAGALGIAQFMPETSASMGVQNPFDPVQAIPASARLLRELIAQFGNLGLAAAAYNAGPKRIQDWLTKKTTLPAETKGYVRTVTGRDAESWKAEAETAHGEQRLPRRAPCQEAAGLYAWNGPEYIPVPTASPLRAAAKVAEKVADQAAEKAEKKASGKHADKAASKTAEKPASKTKAASHEDKGAVQLAARERKHKHSRHAQK
jgi:soluble lytic murein transglycosylase-like protein